MGADLDIKGLDKRMMLVHDMKVSEELCSEKESEAEHATLNEEIKEISNAR